MFPVEFTSAGARQGRKLPPEHRARIQVAIRGLATDPYPQGATKLVGEDTAWRVLGVPSLEKQVSPDQVFPDRAVTIRDSAFVA